MLYENSYPEFCLPFVVTWGLECYIKCTHPQMEYFLKWSTWVICSQNTVDSRVSCGVGTRVSIVRGGCPLQARPCPGSLCTRLGLLAAVGEWRGSAFPFPRLESPAQTWHSPGGDSGWWEPGTTKTTRWCCSEALFLLQQLFPGPGFHCRLDTRVTCPVGTMGNLGVDKSSDFLQDKQLAHSRDRTCVQMSQLQDLFPGAQCIDVRSGWEQMKQN